MKTNGKHEVMTQITRQSLVLAALLAMMLSAASISRAQSSATPAAISAAKPAVVPAKAPASHAAKPAARGQHEGITVHGHWVIEVKNSDGKLVTHREFENALSPGFSFTFAGANGGEGGALPGGASLLSALITGQNIVTPAAWAISLGGGISGACVTPGFPVGLCILVQNSPTSFLANNLSEPCPSPSPGVSCNLTVSPQGTAPNFTGFQLFGTIVATQAGTVAAVSTMDVNACGVNGNLANCTFTNTEGMVAFTAANLDGNTVPGDPLPVLVSAGQTIAVTVTISFQ